jgi:glutamate/tyrosine decarboxylase-like PLP-dependent enzyme
MRAFGRLVVDLVIEHMTGLRDMPAGRKTGRARLEGMLREPPPEQGADFRALLPQLRDTVFDSIMHVDHPRFFGFVPSPGNFASVMADVLASGFNAFVGTWFSGSGPAQIELVTIDWLRQFCGLPESAGGLFLSGGSMANLTALAVARHHHAGSGIPRNVVYCSDQTHSSIDRALRVLGFSPAQVRRIPSDQGFRLPVEVLRREIALDRAAGRAPFCVVANAGTTNTGAVDPLRELSLLCRDERIWLHADGAFGAAAALSERGRRQLDGLEMADSLALDPHKWLFQPYEIGCVLIRDGELLKETFRIMPEYLRDVHRHEEEVNFCDRGVQLTRGFRALKLWLSLKVFGVAAFREAIEWGFHLAEVAEARLRQSSCWEIVSPAGMATVAFRWAAPAGEQFHDQLAAAMLDDGFAVLTSTVLRGSPVLRLCTINPRTTEQDVVETIDRLERLARDLT